MSDLHKFIFDGVPVRGMLVRLTDSWQDVLGRREGERAWPAPVAHLLGELAAAATLMQANLKFDGALVMQVQGDGPVRLAVAESMSDLRFRVTAKVVGDIAPDASFVQLVDAGGDTRCAITLDPRRRDDGQQPYQGIVPLSDEDGQPVGGVAAMLELYMRQSEQLDTRIVLAADGRTAAGLLIQRIPVEGVGNLEGQAGQGADAEGDDDAFTRIAHLASTLKTEELLGLDAEAILRRLFWEEPLRLFPPQHPSFSCSCSTERVRAMLKSLGREESDSILAERDDIEIGCDFCGAQYHFDAVDVGELFTPVTDQPPASSNVH